MSTTVEEIEKTETDKDAKSKLLLDSLEIKGYRCFEHLTIEKLGRVNLIVGKNNVGKTNLLEAVWIYSQKGAVSSVLDILRSRDEIQVTKEDYGYSDEILKGSINNIGNLFYQRPNVSSTVLSEAIVETSKNGLSIKVGWYVNNEGNSLEISKNPNANNAKLYYVPYFEDSLSIDNESDSESPEKVAEGTNLEEITTISESIRFSSKFNESMPTSYFLKYDGLSSLQASRLWDNISLTDFEEEVIKSLKIIAPDIKKVGFLSPSKNNSLRVAMGRLTNQIEPIPLRAFGDGMNRLLGIILALVNCRGGILLIDEIESGLHYSVLPDVWKLIFKTARDLNVQVFATTHSKDCVEAFAQAADESPEDGMVIRLERHGEKIVAKAIEEENLVLAVDYGAEVR